MVSDFLNGLFNGLRDQPSREAAPRPRVRRVARAPGVTTPLESAVRAAIFLLAMTGVAVVALNLWKRPSAPAQKSATKPLRDGAQDLASILAVDDAAEIREWQYIVIHHSASVRGSAQSFDQYHRQRGWQGLGYHFVIGNGTDQGDGVIIAGPRWYQQEAGAHAHSTLYNERGIGICLVGNFEDKPPSEAQMAALTEMVLKLAQQYKIDAEHIVGHNQIRQGGTLCPGRFFPMTELRDRVRALR